MSRNQQFSIVEYHSRQERNRCGYCRSSDTSFSHGMSAQSLTVQDYQSLIDRGWRRSGNYCYKPIMDTTCCPHYTIKCNALDFKMSKSQKKIIKRMIKFLKNELQKDDKTSLNESNKDIDRSMEIPDFPQHYGGKEMDASKMQVISVSEELANKLSPSVSSSESSTNVNKHLSKDAQMSSSPSQPMETTETKTLEKNFDPSRAPQRKAKLIRIERARNRLLAQGKTSEEIDEIVRKKKQQKAGKTLEDYFDEIKDCPKKLELKLVRTSPTRSSYKKTAKESFELYKKYQMGIHNDLLMKLTEDRYSRFLVRSPLRMKLVRVMSREFLQTLDNEADLFKKYQMAIHKEKPKDCNKLAFFEFLVQNPLQEWTPDDGPPQGYGSFHEQYWLNDRLIAVAVIDILPFCLSSVYFFYDPSYSHLSLGTFSSLREVMLTRQLNKHAPSLKFYYMGYYIHTCPKMRYKAKVHPSKLLCPESYVWCDIAECLPKLDASKYCRLNEDLSAQDEDGNVDINQVLILHGRKAMYYRVWKTCFASDSVEDMIKEYASLVGKKCATSMLYYIED